MSRWRFGQRVKRDAYLRSVVRRGEWAARMAGVPAGVITRLRWRFWTSLRWGDKAECLGGCLMRGAVIWIDLVSGSHVEATACHELAHAAHRQGTWDANGHPHDDHDEVWAAWLRKIRRYYYRDKRGPCVVRS